MEELYAFIEEKIKASGFPGEISGRDFYNDVSAEADEQELGTYMFIIKKTEFLTYQGVMDVLEEQFDLHTVDIILGEKTFHIDFDA